jgi:hypothetical protein
MCEYFLSLSQTTNSNNSVLIAPHGCIHTGWIFDHVRELLYLSKQKVHMLREQAQWLEMKWNNELDSAWLWGRQWLTRAGAENLWKHKGLLYSLHFWMCLNFLHSKGQFKKIISLISVGQGRTHTNLLKIIRTES